MMVMDDSATAGRRARTVGTIFRLYNLRVVVQSRGIFYIEHLTVNNLIVLDRRTLTELFLTENESIKYEYQNGT